ncbi:MAG: hypothetical protein M1830_002056, partial [Pleopsidium flavum]
MARASSVTSTPDYRKKRHALAPPALADEEAALHMDEPADEEAKDSVSKQLFHEQDMGAAVSKEDLAVGIHEPTEQLLESPSTQDRDVSDDQLTQSAAAIFNTLSLRGKPGMQKAETEPRETRASKASLERRKRQTPVNAPVSPSKRSTPAAVAADKARASGIGKLERPAFVYGNLSKRKTRARKDTSNVLELSHKPRKMKTAVRAISSVPSDTRESQTASASAADADGAAHSTKPTVEENKAVQGEDEGEGNDRPEQLGTTTNSARSERLKKSKAGRSANQPTLEPRTTRSADRNLRNSGVEVVISAPDWSKKPEDALKTKKGSNSTTRHPGRPRTLGREARASVQVDNGAKPIPSSRKPAARVTKPGTRISARNGGRGAVNPRSNTRKQEDHGQNKKGQDHVHEQDLVDGNEEEAEHEEADERIEEGGEEITTRSSGPAENEVAVDVVGTEADDHDEPDGYLSDGVAGDQLEMDHSAQDEDDEEDSDHETANGKPQVEMPFEQQANWDKVLEGAESVGVSQRNGVTRRRKPKLVTKTVKALVRLSSALTQLYMEHGTLYADRENMDEDSVERLEPLRKALDHGLRVLGSRIENIDEDHAGAEKNEMIRDIYTHGIPGLVFLLQAVLLCFVNAPRIRDSDIQLIIRTQTLVLHLCEKAVNWTAKPESDRPIIRSTRQFILPYLREINN